MRCQKRNSSHYRKQSAGQILGGIAGAIGIFAAVSVAFYCFLGLPVSAEPAPKAESPAVSAKAAVLMDARSGKVIFGKNEKDKLPVASTTKILTTLLMLESGNLETEFEMGSEILVEGSSMGLLEGDLVSKRDLCYGMMLPSGNDAANATAYILGGGTAGFSELMNRRAASIGMSDSHFITPSGLHAANHYSTAYDMGLLTRAALQNPDFAEIAKTESIKLKYGNPPYARWLSNSNKLLTLYDGCIGVKTGFTDEAGRCLVSAAERGGVKLICVTLNAPNDWADHRKLLDYGFELVKPVEVDINLSELDSKTDTVNVVGGASDTAAIELTRKPVATAIDNKLPQLDTRIILPDFVYAPVRTGDIVGRAEIIADGSVLDTVDLIAAEDVEKVSKKQPKALYYSIIDFLKKYV
jgi:D-alanyl-D-alanine carboxypeptidase/D-alanyl-D-alanine carboxypeptidase (penicillin-binding protein 5/6)